MSIIITAIQTFTGTSSLCNKARKRKEKHSNWRERSNIVFTADDVYLAQ